ncbi:MAG: hypothetical protein QMC80_01750 [Thermoplasmatales archaeon]|nr:hypothetical protein [Thermoplasmatales archaeon]
MKKEIKVLICSMILLTVSLIGLTADMFYNIGLWWLFSITFWGYLILFILFLYLNHESMKKDYSKNTSLKHYKNAMIVCFLLLVAGVTGSSVDIWMGLGSTQVFFALAEGSFIGLIYSIIGWDDIRRKIKQ